VRRTRSVGRGRRARDRDARGPVRVAPGARVSDAHVSERHEDTAVRVEALEALLVEKGLVDPDVVDDVIEHYETSVGPLNGAKVVARAWSDAQYRERLLADATKAVAELGFGGTEGQMIVAVGNTPSVHNVVVCT